MERLGADIVHAQPSSIFEEGTLHSVVSTSSRGIFAMQNQLSGKGLQRAQLAHLTGCHLETIRYYETIGLLRDPPRSASGYRVYDQTDVRRLRFILRARELGFGIDEIHGLLHLVDCKSQTCAEVQHRTEPHLAAVRAKIADLQRIEATLATMISQCSGDAVPECPILDALAA